MDKEMREEIEVRRKAVELIIAADYNAEVVDGDIALTKKNDEPMSREEFIKIMRLLKENNLVSCFPNPDPCWIIKNPAGKALSIRGDLMVFSSRGAVNRFVENCCPRNFRLFIYKMSWRRLIERFGEDFKIAILDYADYAGEDGYMRIPLLEIPESEGRA